MSFANTGKVWTPETFADYLKAMQRTRDWQGVCLHHTAAPSLSQRPQGLKLQHIMNIRDFYQKEKGWSAGPHLFTDEDQIFGMTPLNVRGIHAVSFNHTHIGIEALGDYDSEDPMSGRGLQVWKTTARTAAVLLDWMGLEPSKSTVKFHRDDPKTTKTCPGRKVSRGWVLELIESADMLTAPKPPTWQVIINGTPVNEVIDLGGRPSISAALAFTLMGCSDLSPVKTVGSSIHSAKGDELEGAKYLSEKGETFAPARELAEAAGWDCLPAGKVITLSPKGTP